MIWRIPRMNKSIRNVFIDVLAGMVRNSATLRKNIGKGGKRKKEMTQADIKKSAEELKPYWDNVFKKIREGTLYPVPPGE